MATSAGKGKKAPKPLSPREALKLKVAEELGLLEKVRRLGWAELTAAESGRVGGLMTRRMREGALNRPKS